MGKLFQQVVLRYFKECRPINTLPQIKFISESCKIMTDKRKHVLAIQDVSDQNAGLYTCTIKGTTESSSCDVKVILGAVKIKKSLKTQTAKEGETVTFEIELSSKIVSISVHVCS